MTNGGGPYHEDKRSQIKVEEVTERSTKESTVKKSTSASGKTKENEPACRPDATRPSESR